MTTAERIARVRAALCDPDAPWYGSNVVPWVDDLMTELETAASILAPLGIPTCLGQLKIDPSYGHGPLTPCIVVDDGRVAWIISAGRVHPKT